MKFDFDKVIDRKGTNSLKYDFARERGMREDAIPLWVADMDFQTAPGIIEQIQKTVQHGIFGYSEGKDEYFNSVYNWYKNNFGWEIKKNWIIKTPGVVFGISAAIRAFTKEGDGVLIQKPVYYPFSEVIEDNNRVLVNNSLKNINGHYEIDFDDFENKIKKNNVKIFLLCSPHNPVGRVWKEWELRKLADICLKYNVLIISDEIHSDFIYPGNTHIVLASLSEKYADIIITCTAPSKTFNLAGLQVSNIFIPNGELRRKFKKAVAAVGYSQVNVIGLVACEAAYKEGAEWLKQLKEYLQGNLTFVREYLRTNIPQVELIEPEGTYLIWLDFRKLNLTKEQLEDLIINGAKLWLDSGAIFGDDSEGYQRINIACPRVILRQALDQLKEAVDNLK